MDCGSMLVGQCNPATQQEAVGILRRARITCFSLHLKNYHTEAATSGQGPM